LYQWWRRKLAPRCFLCSLYDSSSADTVCLPGRWVEMCISEKLPSVAQFEEELANGVVLGKLACFFSPKTVKAKSIFDPDMTMYRKSGKKFRHVDNISRFIAAMEALKFPRVYQLETVDCYDRKNTPKCIFCLHALRYSMAAPNRQCCLDTGKFPS